MKQFIVERESSFRLVCSRAARKQNKARFFGLGDSPGSVRITNSFAVLILLVLLMVQLRLAHSDDVLEGLMEIRVTRSEVISWLFG